MKRQAGWCCVLFSIWACTDKPAPAAPTPSPPATQAAPPAPVTTAAAAPPAIAPNPCDTPGPLTLELKASKAQQTPWDVEFRYAVDEDRKLGSGFMFQLRSGERRWETRRTNRNWNQPLTWRGYCWRGAERPKPRATQLKIEIAPVCKDGKLQELGGCGSAFGSS